MKDLEEKIRALPLGLHLKIEEFVDSLLTLEKQKKGRIPSYGKIGQEH